MEEAKARCPKCGAAFPAGARFCPTCSYELPSSATAAPEVESTPKPSPAPPVVYVPPSTPAGDSSAGAWAALIIFVVLLAAGVLLWNSGYLGMESSSATPSVTIENSPQISPQQQPADPPAQVTPPASPPPQPPPPPSKQPDIEIVSVRAEALETGSIEWKYGYTLKLRNNTIRDARVDLKIEFVDAQGFTVDDDLLNGAFVPANSEREFHDFDMLKAALAEKVKTVRAELR